MAQLKVDLRTLDLGNAAVQPVTGRQVRTLQGLLNVWLRSADTPAHQEPAPLLELDGVGGRNTHRIAIAFQSAQGLVDDAVIGPQTWKKLIEQDSSEH